MGKISMFHTVSELRYGRLTIPFSFLPVLNTLRHRAAHIISGDCIDNSCCLLSHGLWSGKLFLKGSCDRQLVLSLVVLRVMDGTLKSWSTAGTPKDPWMGSVEPSLSLTSSLTVCSLVTVELPLWPICYEVLIRAELIPVPWPEFPEVSAK